MTNIRSKRPILAILALSAAFPVAAASTGPVVLVSATSPHADNGFNALDGRKFTGDGANPVTGGFVGLGAATRDHDPDDGLDHSALGLGAADPAAAPPSDALPLSQLAGPNAKVATLGGRPSVWDLINRVRYGGLPEPASWALILLGFGMIGGAARGFVVANRKLAKLQPEEQD